MNTADEAYEQRLRDRRRRQLQRLADAADNMADTAEAAARVHDQMTQPGAAEHAARERLLATAEREAAQALRAGELPSPASREVIRASGSSPEARAARDRRANKPDAERR